MSLLLQGSTTPGCATTLGSVSRDRSGRSSRTTRATRGYASSFRRGSNDSSDRREEKRGKIIVGIRCGHDAFIRGTLHRRNPMKTLIIPSLEISRDHARHWLLTSGRPYSPGTNETESRESVGL